MSARRAVLLGLLLSAAASVRAQISVRVLETDPPSPATLDRWERFCVRVGYESDRPIYVRGEAFFGGAKVPGMNGGSYPHEAGKGEALFWFSYATPVKIDRIAVAAQDAAGRPLGAAAEIPVAVEWTARVPAARRPNADWVARLDAENERRQKAASREYASRPTPWWQSLLFLLMGWSVPGYLVVQVLALRRTRGGWRIAAAAPLAPMAAVLAHAVFALSRGSSLFPLLLIFSSSPALVYLLVLLALRALRAGDEPRLSP